MDQKRLFVAIAVSLAILLAYQLLVSPHLPHPAPSHIVATQAPAGAAAAPAALSPAALAEAAAAKNAPRLQISAPKVEGSISLLGARLDHLVLRDYHTTIKPDSPLVTLLRPVTDSRPYYIQYGWSAAAGQTIGGQAIKLPGQDTLWTASAKTLTDAAPVTLSWDNGQGLVFQLIVSIDRNYMFSVDQKVINNSKANISLFPWSRVRRDYTPPTLGYYLLHEGPVGVLKGTLHEMTYAGVKSAAKRKGGLGFSDSSTGGWAGITDKYWLAALIPDQKVPVTAAYRQFVRNGQDGYQVDFVTDTPLKIAPGAAASLPSRAFAGAKLVDLLDRYQSRDHIPSFDKAVDFGLFYFLTKPIFYALDFLNKVLGNFGLAIMAFTVLVKLLFFPLANKSYRSMSKMKLLAPKMQAIRERFKDDPTRQQQEVMGLYKAEKVNPVSGCLPMVIQIPVFFCLYKDIFVTIEMRHAPFFGWIHDLSAIDPTNIFNLFGLIPFDPTTISPFLHLGIWPIIMGFTMFFQQKLNPPPPDPVQAKLFQFMPLLFTFMLARFPAGLVIYWSWNNTLTIAQQWLIMRRTKLHSPRMVRT